MQRRSAIKILAGGLAFPSLVARAQTSSASPKIGYLSATSAAGLEGFLRGLKEQSFVEGTNISIEYKWSDGRYDQLPSMAADLVDRKVVAILAAGLPAALAAKAATSEIPVVFVIGTDPVRSGVVASFDRPTGNLTGVSQFFGALGGKRLELLREIDPKASVVGVLTNSNNPNSASHLADVQQAAEKFGQTLITASARNEVELAAAFEKILGPSAKALLVADDPFFTVNRKRIIELATQAAIPTIYYTREFAADGGLISYGSNPVENQRLAGAYVARILKGAKPADLPILLPTTFELVINRRAANALGIEIPPKLLAFANEIID